MVWIFLQAFHTKNVVPFFRATCISRTLILFPPRCNWINHSQCVTNSQDGQLRRLRLTKILVNSLTFDQPMTIHLYRVSRRSNVFGSILQSVCVCVCVPVCSLHAELLDLSSKNDRVTTNQIQINGNHSIFFHFIRNWVENNLYQSKCDVS